LQLKEESLRSEKAAKNREKDQMRSVKKVSKDPMTKKRTDH